MVEVPPLWDIPARFLQDATGRFSCRTAIVENNASWTYQELAALVIDVSTSLRKAGCQPGDRVLLGLSNSPQFLASFFGVAKLGCMPVLVNPASSAADLAYYLSDSGAEIAIVENPQLEFDRDLHNRPGTLIVVGPDSGLSRGETSWQDFIQGAEPAVAGEPGLIADPKFLLYTSGSTGRQKGVLHSCGSLASAAKEVGQGVFGFTANDRVFSFSNFCSAFGLGFGMYFPLCTGASILLGPASLDPNTAARMISTGRPTILVAVPNLLATLLKAARHWLTLDLSSVRFIASAGEPLPAEVFAGFRDLFGVEVVDGIGSTEMLSHYISNRPGHARALTCGVETPGCEVRLLGDDGEPVLGAEVGTLWVKAPTAFLEYWRLPEQTARTKSGEWVSTGDKLSKDAEGFYTFWGRADDMIKISGYWVAPAAVVAAACAHPGIANAALTTSQDQYGSRRLVAYIVPAPGCSPKQTEILKHLSGRLPRHMLPSALILVPALPLTANGKLDRRALPKPQWSRVRTAE